jgi:hypothetical protein
LECPSKTFQQLLIIMRERHPFYSEAGSDLFNECPFHSSQLTPQV